MSIKLEYQGNTYQLVPCVKEFVDSCEGCAGQSDTMFCHCYGCDHCEDGIFVKISNENNSNMHNHYFKSVKGLDYVDVYRIIDIFKITDPCIQHALKKLLVAGGRGHKDIQEDIQNVIDTLERWKVMQVENGVMDVAQKDNNGGTNKNE